MPWNLNDNSDPLDSDLFLFQAGTHEEAIRMSMADYRRLVTPKVMDLTYHGLS